MEGYVFPERLRQRKPTLFKYPIKWCPHYGIPQPIYRFRFSYVNQERNYSYAIFLGKTYKSYLANKLNQSKVLIIPFYLGIGDVSSHFQVWNDDELTVIKPVNPNATDPTLTVVMYDINAHPWTLISGIVFDVSKQNCKDCCIMDWPDKTLHPKDLVEPSKENIHLPTIIAMIPILASMIKIGNTLKMKL